MKTLLRGPATIVGAIGLALFLYAVLALPGFLSVRDSTVPAVQPFTVAAR